MTDDRFTEDAEEARSQLVADWREAGGECSWHDDCEGFGCRGCLRAYERARSAPEPVVAPVPPVATPAVEHNRKVAALTELNEAKFPFDPSLTALDIRRLTGLQKLRGIQCRATAQSILELHVAMMTVPTPDQRRV